MLAVRDQVYFTLERGAMIIGVSLEMISSLIVDGKLHKVRFENIDRVSGRELAMLSPDDFLGLSLLHIDESTAPCTIPYPAWLHKSL
jgi:hypothetical protein